MQQASKIIPESKGAEYMSAFEIELCLMFGKDNSRHRQELRDREKAMKKLVFCAKFNANRRTNKLTVFTSFMGGYSEDKLEWHLPRPNTFSLN